MSRQILSRLIIKQQIQLIVSTQINKMNDSSLKKPTPIKNSRNRLITFNQTFESSIIDKGEKFSLDKTLVKGIKQNDPSKIIQNGQQADLGNTTELYNEQKQLNGMLFDTRKKYDQTKQTTSKLQQKIDKLKREKEKLQNQKAQTQSMVQNEENQFKNIQAQLQKLNDMCDSAQYTKDIRLQIGEVLKQDILYYKKNCFEANIKIVRNHNRLKTLNGQYQSSKKVSTNCRTLIHSIEKKITEKQHQRSDKINSYYDVLNRKLQNNEKKQQRSKMMESSMMEALIGKMPEELEQKKLLQTNMVLKRMLKTKMERQMQKHNEIETSFRQIQQNTTVKRAQQFITRFIERQKNYGQLLDSISKNEQKINRLKQQKQQLEKQNHELLHQKQAMEDLEHQKKGQLNKQATANIDILRQRLLHNERLKNKTFNFASKLIAVFEEKNIDEVKNKMSRKKPHLCLKEALEKVNSYLNSVSKDASKQQIREVFTDTNGMSLPLTVRTKNLRIKTLTTREETQNSAMEDHDIAYDDLSEHSYLNHNRRQIKKSVYLRNRLKTKA